MQSRRERAGGEDIVGSNWVMFNFNLPELGLVMQRAMRMNGLIREEEKVIGDGELNKLRY